MNRARLIGITGGIGSGKSVVSRILRLSGEQVYDCDSEARRIMESDDGVIHALTSLLGQQAYTKEGSLNRNYISSRLFCERQIREGVNAIVHAAVKEDVKRLAEMTEGSLFCESAILFTSGISELCEEIWLVTAPEWQRIERVKRRNGLPEEEIARRIQAQVNEFDSIHSCKVVEIPNGDNDLLLPLINSLIHRPVPEVNLIYAIKDYTHAT